MAMKPILTFLVCAWCLMGCSTPQKQKAKIPAVIMPPSPFVVRQPTSQDSRAASTAAIVVPQPPLPFDQPIVWPAGSHPTSFWVEATSSLETPNWEKVSSYVDGDDLWFADPLRGVVPRFYRAGGNE